MGQHTEAERKQWFELISEYEESGLSRTKFCKQKSISLNAFTYYRSLRLKQEKPVKEFKSPFLELSLPSASFGVVPVELSEWRQFNVARTI